MYFQPILRLWDTYFYLNTHVTLFIILIFFNCFSWRTRLCHKLCMNRRTLRTLQGREIAVAIDWDSVATMMMVTVAEDHGWMTPQ